MTQSGMLLYGIVYLLVAVFFGTLTIFLFFKLFNALTRKINDIEELKKNNIAVGILNASLVFAMALFISESIETAMEAFKNNIVVFGSELTAADKWKTYLIMISHYVIALVVSFVVLWLSVKIFTWLTRSIDEFKEIEKNNVSVAIVLATVIIAMSLIIKPGIGKFLKGIIDYPMPRAQSSALPVNPLENRSESNRR